MNVLMTGVNGFIGQNLINFFYECGFKIQKINRNQISEDYFRPYIRNNNAYIHLAGIAHDLKKTNNSLDYYYVNTELTKKVFDLFLTSTASVFITLSSVKAVADSINEELTEELPPNPKTDYGKSKLLAEQYIFSKPIPHNKRVYILRPCMIHGPGNKGNLNLLYKAVKIGIPYPLAAFRNKRSFLSVGNLCFVIKELIERNDIPSGIYQVADDQSLSTNEVVQLISEVSQKNAHLWGLPKAVIIFLARLGDWFGLPLNSERLQKLTENYIVSNVKLKKALQKELPLTAEEGLRITLRSFAAKQASSD